MYYECLFNETEQKTASYKEIEDDKTVKSVITDYANETDLWWKYYSGLLAQDAVAGGEKWAPYCEQTKSVVLLSGNGALNVGETSVLTARILPLTIDVTWSTSDKTIATVKAGTVTAVAAGTATITATDTNGNTGTVTITVTEAE